MNKENRIKRSMLGEINQYIQENDIVIRRVEISINSWPICIKKAVLSMLKMANWYYNDDTDISKISVCIDDNKHSYFMINGNDDRTIVIIAHDDEQIEFLRDSKVTGKKILESTFIEQSQTILENMINNLRDQYEALNVSKYMQLVFKAITPMYSSLADNIMHYLKYCDDEYKLAIAPEETAICFKPTHSITSHDGKTKVGTPYEPKYDTIPFEERERILLSHNPAYIVTAYDAETQEKTHRCMYYKEQKKLIMEPISGDKYTNVAYLGKEPDTLTREDIEVFCQMYLSCSRNELTDDETITRHAHTTVGTYKLLVGALLGTENISLLSCRSQQKIKTAEQLNRRP